MVKPCLLPQHQRDGAQRSGVGPFTIRYPHLTAYLQRSLQAG